MIDMLPRSRTGRPVNSGIAMLMIGLRVGLVGVIAVALTACVSQPVPSVLDAPPVARVIGNDESPRIELRLSPESLSETISLLQHITVERDGQTQSIDVVVEIDPERIDLVGLVFNQRVMSLHYDGKTLRAWRHDRVPEQLRPEDVLSDFQLAFWPAETISEALPSGWTLRDDNRRRVLSLGEEPVVLIEYAGEFRWAGVIELENLRYGYRLVIESTVLEP